MSDLSAVVDYAEGALGKPYVWGATGPNAYDCSGLVYAAYKAAGYAVSRTTAANLGRQGQAVDLASAPIGSVVYFDEKGATDHVGILVDKNDGGHMIDAPTFGKPVERVGIGHPTSIRDISGGVGNSDRSTGTPGPGGGGGGLLAQPAGVLSWLSGSWQGDVLGIALKVGGGATAAALVVIGVRESVKG